MVTIFAIPTDTLPSTCRAAKCLATIFWIKTYSWLTHEIVNLPVNLDGTSHFITCTDVDKCAGRHRNITPDMSAYLYNELMAAQDRRRN